MTTVTREHLAGLKLALECVGYSNSETSAWDKYEELEQLIAQASAAPEQEAVAFVADSCLRNLRVSGFDSYSALLHKQQASMVSPQLVALYTHPSAEIEQLRESLEFRGSLFARVEAERNELRKKLAEAQALLRRARRFTEDMAWPGKLRSDIDAFLFATAQPAECETCGGSQVVATTDKDHEGNSIECRCPMCAQPAEVKS